MKHNDIVFLCETHCNVKSVEEVYGFTAFGDPSFPLFQRHGGLVAYIKNSYSQYVHNLRFTKCTISFSIYIIPKIFFIGVYIYPGDSVNYEDADFGTLIEEINYWLSKGYVPYIGGDLNSRIGDISKISEKSLNWRYDKNVDNNTNLNYNNFSNICEILKILPLNHCIYGDSKFEGNWTYFNANRKSQIDYVLTNNKGRQHVQTFTIIKTGWHFSDHLPIEIEINAPINIDIYTILIRARSLNEEYSIAAKDIKTFKGKYDQEEAQNLLKINAVTIMHECATVSTADNILTVIYRYVDKIIQSTRLRKEINVNKNYNIV